jgi:hypothetical protein
MQTRLTTFAYVRILMVVLWPQLPISSTVFGTIPNSMQLIMFAHYKLRTTIGIVQQELDFSVFQRLPTTIASFVACTPHHYQQLSYPRTMLAYNINAMDIHARQTSMAPIVPFAYIFHPTNINPTSAFH